MSFFKYATSVVITLVGFTAIAGVAKSYEEALKSYSNTGLMYEFTRQAGNTVDSCGFKVAKYVYDSSRQNKSWSEISPKIEKIKSGPECQSSSKNLKLVVDEISKRNNSWMDSVADKYFPKKSSDPVSGGSSQVKTERPCSAVEGNWECKGVQVQGLGPDTNVQFLSGDDVKVFGETDKITGVPEHISPNFAPNFWTITTCTSQGLKVLRGIDPDDAKIGGVVWRLEPRNNGRGLFVAIEYGSGSEWAGDEANTYNCVKK